MWITGGGATVMSGNNWGQKAVTLSSFIIGDRTISADPNNSVFQHEYGHYLQSQSMGWGYLSRIGIPSLMSADGSGEHKYQPHEQDANARAFLYFNRHVSGFYQTEAQYDTNIERETVLDGILKLTLWILIIQVKDMNIVIIIILALGMLLVI